MKKILNQTKDVNNVLGLYEASVKTLGIAGKVLVVALGIILFGIGFNLIHWLLGIRMVLIAFGIYGTIMLFPDFVKLTLLERNSFKRTNKICLVIDSLFALVFLALVVVAFVI